MLTIRMMSVDTFGILILMSLWVILGLAGTLAELTRDRSAMGEQEFPPDIDRQGHTSPDRWTGESSTEWSIRGTDEPDLPRQTDGVPPEEGCPQVIPPPPVLRAKQGGGPGCSD